MKEIGRKRKQRAVGVLAVWMLALLLLTGMLSGCRSVPASAGDGGITGRWEDAYGLSELEFRTDGTMRIEALNLGSFEGSYAIEGDQLTFSYSVLLEQVTEEYVFRLEDGKLYLNDEAYTRRV